MNAPFATPVTAPVACQRSQQVHWLGFKLSWNWDFSDGEGPQEIILDITASSEGHTIHGIKFAGEFLDDATESVICAVLENDGKFLDYLSTRIAEEADEARAWAC